MEGIIYEFKKEKYPNEIFIANLSKEECESLKMKDCMNVQEIYIEDDKKLELLLNGWCDKKRYYYRSFIF